MKKYVILAIVAVLAGLAIAGSGSTNQVATVGSVACISNTTDIIAFEQGPIIGVVIMATVVLIAVAYAVGNATHNANYIVFAKDELYHLGFSVLLLIGFSGILVASCAFMGMFYETTFTNLQSALSSGCYSPGDTMNAVSVCYMNLVRSDALRLSESYIHNHIKYLMDSTFAISIQIPMVDAYTVTGAAYKRIISNQYDMILNAFLVPALMSLNMQKLMLNFINENVIRWILPIAFLLRVFIPTRHMGNILIGLAVGLYIIVPFMYAFTLSMYDVVLNSCNDYANVVCDNPIDNYSCPGGSVACSNPDGFWNVGRLVPQAFFLPNLILVMLITFMTAVNKALRVVG